MLVADVEANGLTPTEIHCCVVYDTIVNEEYVFEHKSRAIFPDFVKTMQGRSWVFHNGLGYDLDVLNSLWSAGINYRDVIDTMVVSKTKDFKKYQTHSLDEIGTSLGYPKGNQPDNWDVYTPDMLEYCKQDVLVTSKILNHFMPYIKDPTQSKALRLEHDTAYLVCKRMGDTGFKFNKPKAEALLDEVSKELSSLEESISKSVPPVRKEIKRLKYKTKADGTLFANVLNAKLEYPLSYVEGDELVVISEELFNPASPKERIDLLWDSGWKPVDKTDGHIKHLRSSR